MRYPLRSSLMKNRARLPQLVGLGHPPDLRYRSRPVPSGWPRQSIASGVRPARQCRRRDRRPCVFVVHPSAAAPGATPLPSRGGPAVLAGPFSADVNGLSGVLSSSSILVLYAQSSASGPAQNATLNPS